MTQIELEQNESKWVQTDIIPAGIKTCLRPRPGSGRYAMSSLLVQLCIRQRKLNRRKLGSH
eukprot:scaffold434031_cov41-Prasinocladus_malaysianus.AAC.2